MSRGMDFKDEEIDWAIGEYALELDGYCSASLAHYDDKCRERFFEDFKKYFYIPNDKLLIRTQLFMLQRWFGKWGGEQTPAYDRDYSLYYLLYLEAYRYRIPSIFKSDWDYHDRLPKDANEDTLENLAGGIRRHFVGDRPHEMTSIDYKLNNYFSNNLFGFLDNHHLLSRPEVLLAASINPVLAVTLFLCHSSEATNFNEGLAQTVLQEAIRTFGNELATMTTSFKFSQDDIRNHLYFFILQAWLERHLSSIDLLSAEYVLLMFLYLHLYRIELPSYMGREPFYSQWNKLSKSIKEDTAEQFRKKLCIMREERLKRF